MKVKIEIDAGELASGDRRKTLAVSQLIGDICSAEIAEAVGNVGKRFVLSDETAGIHGEYWADDCREVQSDAGRAVGEDPAPVAEEPKPGRSIEDILADYFRENG